MAIVKRIEEFKPDDRLIDERGATHELLAQKFGRVRFAENGLATIYDSAVCRAFLDKEEKGFELRHWNACQKLYGHYHNGRLEGAIGSPDWWRIVSHDYQYRHVKSDNQFTSMQIVSRVRKKVIDLTNAAGDRGLDRWTVLELVCVVDKSFEDAGRAIGYGGRDGAVKMAKHHAKCGLNILAAEWGL